MLKKDDVVVMHTCGEAEHYDGKLWICKADEFTKGEGIYKENLVFLEGFSGSFSTKYLQKVDVQPMKLKIERSFRKVLNKRKKEVKNLQNAIENYKQS